MLKKLKIGIIGAGDIGLNLAEISALQGYDVTVYNRYNEENGKPSSHWLAKMGFIMDLNDSLQLPDCGSVKLTSNLSDLNNQDAIVITAGAKRTKPSETREELAKKNAAIFKSYIDLAYNNPKSRIFIITNPVDSLTQFLLESVVAKGEAIESASRRILGVSCIDTMRLRNIVKETLNPSFPDIYNSYIEGMAIGEHGPSMVPLLSSVKINGKDLSDFASSSQIKQIYDQTVLRGNDIIKLTGNSSVKGPAHAALYMISEILTKQKAELTCSVWDGKRCIGRHVIFYNGYVDHIVDTLMTQMEEESLKASQAALDKQYQIILQVSK